jgi:hypothetical protein
MSIILFSNNAATTLAGPISNSSLTANLAAGSGTLFPNPGADQHFVMTFQSASNPVNDEIVWVTAIVGDTITILRGQEGTTAQAWQANDIASNFVTAGQMSSLLQNAQLPAQFPSLLAAPGYQRLPNGFILQWGHGATVTGNQDAVTFPIPFPAACLQVMANEANALGWNSPPQPTVYGTSTPTTAGFLISGVKFSTSGIPSYASPIAYSWLAWGF